MALGKFDCSGGKSKLSDCQYQGFGKDIGCSYPIKGHYARPTAGVLCYNHAGQYIRVVSHEVFGWIHCSYAPIHSANILIKCK